MAPREGCSQPAEFIWMTQKLLEPWDGGVPLRPLALDLLGLAPLTSYVRFVGASISNSASRSTEHRARLISDMSQLQSHMQALLNRLSLRSILFF